MSWIENAALDILSGQYGIADPDAVADEFISSLSEVIRRHAPGWRNRPSEGIWFLVLPDGNAELVFVNDELEIEGHTSINKDCMFYGPIPTTIITARGHVV